VSSNADRPDPEPDKHPDAEIFSRAFTPSIPMRSPADTSSTQAGTKNDEDQPAESRHERANARATLYYGLAVLIGLPPVFINHQFWPWPILTMLGYAFFGWRSAKESKTFFEFADAFYYLGFTLSVGSLLASTDPFNSGKQPIADDIFHYFGLGMLTTLLGVVGRTLFQTFYRLPTETLETINQRVAVEAERYEGRLKDLSNSVVRTATQAANAYEVVGKRMAEIGGALDTAVTQLSAAGEEARSLHAHTGAAKEAVEKVAGAYEASAASVKKGQASVSEATSALVASVNVAASNTTKAAEQLNLLHDSAHSATGAIGSFKSSVDSARVDVSPLSKSIEEAGSSIAQATGAATREIALFTDAARGFETVADDIRRAASQLDTGPLHAAITSLASQTDALAAAVNAHKGVVDDDVVALHAQVDATQRNVAAIADAIDQIVDVTTKKLDSIGSTI
jgi:hypothetical protein